MPTSASHSSMKVAIWRYGGVVGVHELPQASAGLPSGETRTPSSPRSYPASSRIRLASSGSYAITSDSSGSQW